MRDRPIFSRLIPGHSYKATEFVTNQPPPVHHFQGQGALAGIQSAPRQGLFIKGRTVVCRQLETQVISTLFSS